MLPLDTSRRMNAKRAPAASRRRSSRPRISVGAGGVPSCHTESGPKSVAPETVTPT